MALTLTPVVTVDNTDGLREVRDYSYNRSRTAHLRIVREAGDAGYSVQAWGRAFPEDGGGGYFGRIRQSPSTVESAVHTLRDVWQEQVVRYHESDATTGRPVFPFSDNWDLHTDQDRQRLKRVGLALARVGHDVFKLLFAGDDQGMREITRHLRHALRTGEHVITIESDDLFVPWGMLYTPKADARTELWSAEPEWSFDGFWGYRHLIEHNFARVPGFDSRITVPGEQVVVGLNMDEHVDDDYSHLPDAAFIKPVIEFFEHRSQIEVVVRRNKSELAAGLQDPTFADHITYFGCHGEVSISNGQVGQSYLAFGDERIYGTELVSWLCEAPLPSRPMVFVSACQGGQLASLFYPAFGRYLLDYGARCLVGPQVDLPRVFAREYTERLFTAFLEPGAKLGDIVRSLARTFADEHGNPLGLIFSLYRGLDVHLWPIGTP